MGYMDAYLEKIRQRRSPRSQFVNTRMSALPPEIASTQTPGPEFNPEDKAIQKGKADLAKQVIDEAIAKATVDAVNPGIATAMEKPKPSALMPIGRGVANLAPTPEEEARLRAQEVGRGAGPIVTGMASAANAALLGMPNAVGKGDARVVTPGEAVNTSFSPEEEMAKRATPLDIAQERNPMSAITGELIGSLAPFGISGGAARMLVSQASKLGLSKALLRGVRRLTQGSIVGRAAGNLASGAGTEAITGAIYSPLSDFAQGKPIDMQTVKDAMDEALLFAQFGVLFKIKGTTKRAVKETVDLVKSKRFATAMEELMRADEAAYQEIKMRAERFMNPTLTNALKKAKYGTTESGAVQDIRALPETSMVPPVKGEAGLKTGAKPEVPEEVDLSLENIKGMSDANLRNELLRMGQDATEIAKLSKDELLFRVSGGRLGKGTTPTTPVPPTPIEPKPPKPPDGGSGGGGVPIEPKPVEPVAPAMTPEQQALLDKVMGRINEPATKELNPKAVKIAEQLGVKYDGAVFDPNDKLMHSFTDPVTGGTFNVYDLKKTKARMLESRAEFEAKQKAKASEGKPDLAPSAVTGPTPKAEQPMNTAAPGEEVTIDGVKLPEAGKISTEPTPAPKAVVESGDKRPVRNKEILDAIYAKFAQGKPVISSTATKSWKLTKPEQIRVNADGELQIRHGKNWDTITEDYAEALAGRVGLKPRDKFADIPAAETPVSTFASEGQRRLLLQRANEAKIGKPGVDKILRARGIRTSKEIPKDQFEDILNEVQSTKPKAKVEEPVKTTPKVEPKAPEGETATVRLWQGIPMRKGTEIVPLKDIEVSPEDFQMRGEAFSEKTAASVAKGINANDWLPIQVWENPETKKLRILDGHSRYEGLKRGEIPDAEVFVHRGISFEEAKAIAMKSNFKSDPLDIVGKANAIRMVRESGLKGEKLKTALEDIKTGLGKNYSEAEDLSYLNKNGLFMKLISNPGAVSETSTLGSPAMKQVGRWTGELRKSYPNSLTNQHEQQIYKWIEGMSQKEREKLVARGQKGRQRFIELIEKQITDPTFKKETVLVFKGMDEPIVGAAASPNEAIRNAYEDLKQKTALIEDIRKTLKETGVRPENAGEQGVKLKELIAEREELIRKIGEASDQQQSLFTFSPIGAVYGIEKDDEGNYRYNVGKGLAGMAHSVALAGVIGAGLRYGAKARDIGRTIMAKSRLASMEGRMLTQGGKRIMQEFQDDVLRWQGAYAGRLLRYVDDDFKGLKKADAKLIGQALLKGVRPENEKLGEIYDHIQQMHKVAGRLMRKTAGPTPQRDLFLQNDSPFQMRENYGMTHSLTRDARDAIEADLNIVLSEVAPELAGTDIKRGATMTVPLGQQAQDSAKIQKAVAGWLKRNQDTLSEEMKSVIAHNEARGVNAPETIMAIRKHLGDNVALYRQFGPFHESRSIEFPIQLLEDDVREIIPRYVEGATREIALTRKYGWELPKFKKELEDLALESSWDSQQLAKTMLIYTGGNDIPKWLAENNALRAIFEETSALQYFRLSPRSTLIQATQPVISFLEDLGYTNFAKAVVKLPTEARPVVRRIYNSGVMDVDVLHSVGADNFGWRAISKAVPIYLRQIMFRQANRALQFTAGLAGDRALRDLYKIASKEKGIASERAKSLLSHYFGIDAAKPLSEREMERGIYKYVTNSQLQKNITKETALMSSPTGRRLFTLLKFPLRQAKYQKDLITAHARATRKMGGVGAVLPILRLAAGGFIAGEGYIYLINKMNSWVSGETKFRADRSLGDIWDDPSVRDIVIHALNNYTAIGSMGLFTDVLRFEPSEQRAMLDLKRNVFGLFLIPAVEQVKSGVEKAVAIANDIFISQKQDTSPEELAKRIGKDAYELLFPGLYDVTPRIRTQEERNARFKNNIGRLKRLGYDKEVGQNILKEVERPGVSVEVKTDLIANERMRIRKLMFEKALAGDIAGGRKLADQFNSQFKSFLNPNLMLKLTPKIVNDYRKDRMAGQKDSKSTIQLRQRVMSQEE